MNAWLMFAGLVLAALIGGLLEHARVKEQYEDRILSLTAENWRIKRKYNELIAPADMSFGATIDELLQAVPDESEAKP